MKNYEARTEGLFLSEKQMISITPCGSGKFKPLIHGMCESLTHAGFVVFRPPLHDMTFVQSLQADAGLLAWKGATYAHLQRVAKCDICLIVNPGGYTGVGGTLELGYAVALRKIIVAMQPDTEPARNGLFDFVLNTDDGAQATEAVIKLFRHKTLEPS